MGGSRRDWNFNHAFAQWFFGLGVELMPPLVPLGAAVGSLLATTIIGSVTVGSLLTTVALSGVAYLLQSSSQANSTGGSALDQGVQQTLQEPIYEERLIYGRALVAGRLFFYECKPPYLYLGLEIASHEIDAIEQVQINGSVVTFSGAGAATSKNFVSGATPYAYMSARLGAPGQALDPILAADFAELPASFKQQGHACVVMKCYYGTSADDHNKFWGSGIPQVLFLCRGMKVFDERDATQVQATPSTWKWSNNASLCIAHFLTFSRGMARNWSDLDANYLMAAANHDDEGISLVSGAVEKRYSINGVVNPNAAPADTLQQMLTANLGDLIWSNGVYKIFSGVARTPTRTLNDDTARGDMEVRTTRDRASLINLVRTVFVAPDRAYQTQNGPVLVNAAYQAADGEAHEITLTLPFTSSATMAQRIAKATMERSRAGRTITRSESIDALRLEAADIITIDVGQLPALGGVFKVNKLAINQDTLEFQIEGEEYSPNWTAWSVADEQPFIISPAALAGVN
ncbi:MAG: phage tail protein [Aestuariivirga sp.]